MKATNQFLQFVGLGLGFGVLLKSVVVFFKCNSKSLTSFFAFSAFSASALVLASSALVFSASALVLASSCG